MFSHIHGYRTQDSGGDGSASWYPFCKHVTLDKLGQATEQVESVFGPLPAWFLLKIRIHSKDAIYGIRGVRAIVVFATAHVGRM